MNDLKGVLRITTTMFLFVGFFRLLAYTGETQEQQIERLIKELGHRNPNVNLYASEVLGKIGKDAVPALMQALQDRDIDVRVRIYAAEALGSIGKGAVDAVPALIPLLQDEHGNVRGNVAEA